MRPMRADALGNRARILDAADEVFGARGAAGSTEDVAKLAGVGIATVFRHFPTKQDLLRAVLTKKLERLRDRARDLMAGSDPGGAFFDFFTEVVDGAARKLTILALLEALTADGDDQAETDGAPAQAGEELRQVFGELLERAQEAGAVRRDAGLPEVYALMVGVSRATTRLHLAEPVKERMLALVFDGLRPER
jgi:AcrR family transcriptional regulator